MFMIGMTHAEVGRKYVYMESKNIIGVKNKQL